MVRQPIRLIEYTINTCSKVHQNKYNSTRPFSDNSIHLLCPGGWNALTVNVTVLWMLFVCVTSLSYFVIPKKAGITK